MAVCHARAAVIEPGPGSGLGVDMGTAVGVAAAAVGGGVGLGVAKGDGAALALHPASRTARAKPDRTRPPALRPVIPLLPGTLLAGRSRHWLGAVPAAGVWAARHCLPREYDAARRRVLH